nr:hypothetical protein [uncultured Desulfobacter sp.]
MTHIFGFKINGCQVSVASRSRLISRRGGAPNRVVYTIKDSALAGTVTLMEITGTARNLVAKIYKPVEIFLVAACIYRCLVFFAICIKKYIEKKFRIGPLDTL